MSSDSSSSTVRGKIRGRYSWAKPEQLAELRKDIRTLLADDDAKTAAEIREGKLKEEERKQREAEEGKEEQDS